MSANAQNWLLQLAYDGRHYKGWQIQKDALTVQGELHKALQNLYPELDDVQSWGCSRTDAGVHALAQMVTFIPPESPPIPMNKVQLALNNRLPEDIRVVAISAQEADFHARHKACGKAYTYVLHQGSLDFPFMKPWCWELKEELDLAALKAAADQLIGSHDFSNFGLKAKGQEHINPVKTMRRFVIHEEGGFTCISVIGNSFLYKMVRRMVAFLVAVGQGHYPEADTLKFLQGQSDFQFETAPASGLFLEAVFFDEKELDYWPQGLPFMKLMKQGDTRNNE